MSRKRFLVIGVVLIIGVIGVIAIFVINHNAQLEPTLDLFAMTKSGRLPCVLFYNVNDLSQSSPFPTSFFTNLAGAEIQVDDPQGPDSGHYSAEKCFLHGTNDSRTVTLTLSLPQGYTTSHPTQFNYSVPPSMAFIEMTSPTTVSQVGVQKSS